MAYARYCKKCKMLLVIENKKTTNITCPKCGFEWFVVWKPQLIAPLRVKK